MRLSLLVAPDPDGATPCSRYWASAWHDEETGVKYDAAALLQNLLPLRRLKALPVAVVAPQ
jgi:hypothetical protein